MFKLPYVNGVLIPLHLDVTETSNFDLEPYNSARRESGETITRFKNRPPSSSFLYCKRVRSFFLLGAKSNILIRSKYIKDQCVESRCPPNELGCAVDVRSSASNPLWLLSDSLRA